MTNYGCHNVGAYNRTMYDNCAYDLKVKTSTTPLEYALYEGKYENCNKCKYNNQFVKPYDLVDIESDLTNRNRLQSKCPSMKYKPSCKCPKCAKHYPAVVNSNMCAIVHNNIPKTQQSGISVSDFTCPNVKFIKYPKQF